MSLVLNLQDLRRIRSAQRTLLSGPSHDSFQSWRETVLRQVVRLTGADRAGFLAAPPGLEVPAVRSVGISDQTLRDYLDYYSERELLEPDPVPGVQYLRDSFSRAELGRTEIYTDFWKPHRQFDNLALSGTFEDVGFAGLFLHHDNERVVFGDRGKTLLGLLLPAFEEGLRSWGRVTSEQEELSAVVDGVRDGVRLFDSSGRLLHSNPAFERILAAEPRRREVEAATGEFARALVGHLPRRGSTRGDRPIPAVRRVETPAAEYRLSGTYLGRASLGRAMVLVTLSRPEDQRPSGPWLRKAFGLTRRQAEVALLLAERRSAREIARILSISPHTARHHTEAVMRKLNVRDRRDVEPTIRGESGDRAHREK